MTFSWFVGHGDRHAGAGTAAHAYQTPASASEQGDDHRARQRCALFTVNAHRHADASSVLPRQVGRHIPDVSTVSGVRLPSGPRMKLVVDGAHAVLENVRVDLCCRQIGVPQHHLDSPKVGAPLEKMRGKRMTQHVGTDGRFHTSLARVSLAGSSRSQCESAPVPPPRALTNNRVLLRLPSSEARASLQVPADPHHRLVADRHDPLLVAFPGARQIRRLEVYVGWPQPRQFRDAHPGCVQQLDQRAVPES